MAGTRVGIFDRALKLRHKIKLLSYTFRPALGMSKNMIMWLDSYLMKHQRVMGFYRTIQTVDDRPDTQHVHATIAEQHPVYVKSESAEKTRLKYQVVAHFKKEFPDCKFNITAFIDVDYIYEKAGWDEYILRDEEPRDPTLLIHPRTYINYKGVETETEINDFEQYAARRKKKPQEQPKPAALAACDYAEMMAVKPNMIDECYEYMLDIAETESLVTCELVIQVFQCIWGRKKGDLRDLKEDWKLMMDAKKVARKQKRELCTVGGKKMPPTKMPKVDKSKYPAPPDMRDVFSNVSGSMMLSSSTDEFGGI